jgi:hypothetical protein
MATGTDHRSCVGYPSFERLLVHIATLADDSGEPRSITYRRMAASRSGTAVAHTQCSVHADRERGRSAPRGQSSHGQGSTLGVVSGTPRGMATAVRWPASCTRSSGWAARVVIYQLEVGTIASPDAINDPAMRGRTAQGVASKMPRAEVSQP